MCTADGDGLVNSTAGKLAYFYVYSRDWDGLLQDKADDIFDIDFEGPAEGGPTGVAGSGSFSIRAAYKGGGIHLA